jgi:hypothetical protein
MGAKFFRCPPDAVIRVYNEAGAVIETHQHAGDFKESQRCVKQKAATRRSVTADCEILLLYWGACKMIFSSP